MCKGYGVQSVQYVGEGKNHGNTTDWGFGRVINLLA